MPSPVFPYVYEAMIEEDIEWLLENSPESVLFRNHIVEVLKASVIEYRDRGYMEAMTRRRWQKKDESS